MKKLFQSILLLFTAQQVLAQSQVFTSNGNFTVPSGVTSITIEVVGAGGNGAGNGGGGGGGGGYAKGAFAVTPGTVLTVNIGSGGGGSTGGSTSITGLISATGGANGSTVSNPSIGGGGAGGAGNNGNIVNRTGGSGGGGYWTYFGGGGAGAGGPLANGSNGGNTVAYNGTNCLTPGGSGGAGGGAPGGNGGKGAGFTDSQCSTADPAAPGATYGGGGGGGNGNSSPAQNGAGGYCKIEYGCTVPAAPGNANSTMTVCSGSSATLLASGSGTVSWYSNSTGGSPVATGSVFITTALTTTTTFYAEILTCTTSAQRTAFTVTVHPLPVITMSVSPPPYCVLKPITFTASGGQSYIWNTGGTGSSQTITPQNTVVFPPIVTGFDANGCSNTASMNITVIPNPTVTVSAKDEICLGESVQLTASGADTYSWTGLGTATVITVTPQTSTVYTLTGYSAGCDNMTMVAISVNVCTGIETTVEKTNFLVYPNPSTGAFTIHADRDLTLELHDVSGKLIQSVDLEKKNNRTFKFNELPKGIYFITDNAGGHKQKVIVN